MLKSRYLCGGSVLAVVLAMGLSGQAAAQDQSSTVEEVVVTGSFIAGTPEDAALPVDVISSEDLEKQGTPSTVELLKALPVSSGVLGDTNQFDPRAQGSEGSGSVNLRGLGAQRTLVLINGRRMAPNPFGQAGAGIVDTNIIPSAAIGRVEVLKDGAAAIYGSDAIAGVVNFITRTNVEGLEASASYRNVDGSKGDYTGSLLWGHSWDNGNVLLSAAYQHRSELTTTDRDWATQPYFDNPEGGWSAGNAIAPFLPVTNTPTGAFTPAAGFQLDNGCTPLGGVVQPGALPACLFAYIPFDNLVETENRFQLYGEANADLGDNAKLHIEAFYSETDVPEWNTSPSYLALQTPTATTNPASGLPASVLAGYFVPASNPGFAAYRAANPSQIPAFATGAHIPGVRYRPLGYGGNPAFDNGPSQGLRHYDAFRVSGGLKGQFGDDGIGYDFSLTYGQETGVRTGYDTVVSRFQLALRGYGALNNDPNGCTSAETAGFTTNAGNAAIGCHYFNPFSNAVQSNSITGATNPSFNSALANNPELVRWFFQEVYTKQTQKLFVADAVFNGELGIELGGGNIGWAAGAQFRRSFFTSIYNDLSNIDANPCIDTPITGTTSCTVRNGPLMFLGTGEQADLEADVYAVFAELAVPLTDDIQIQLAARYEDYGGETGSTLNPKGSIRWQAADWLAFRASASTTFRGPPLTSLTNNSVTALSFIGGSFRAIDIFGNPSLEPETAKTYSAGAIVEIGNFNATVDYWRFDFDNPIVGEPSGSIVNTMFPGGSAVNCNNPAFAGLQARFTFQGACGITTIARVRTQVVNGPPVKTSGVDVLANYDFDDVMGGRLRLGGSITYTLEYKVDPFAVGGVTVEKAFDAAGYLNYQLSATSLPQLKGSVFAEYTAGPHNLRWTVNYIDSYVDQRTSIFAPNPVNGAIQANGAKIDETWLHEIDYRVFLPWDTTVNLSIDNVFDTEPSFARLDLNYDPFTGSALGRTYKLGVKKKF
ncbi:MAG: TonB-dependent receptor [Phenylobacterium sp.]|uniref:TonB-dependent receptor n=1 Tax=Phenylobacterium sp. TaxID=1871053 RepID=UPI002733C28A|nr:TonB-dependent receptor [Phenylobacterium sp.]MDP3749849.1 TonB-dependent receptor [Phenylobacterium sp.]